jgi:hypothetical protein
MTSLALFLQECLTEEKYGSTFVSEIDQRLETLNYTQLIRMHEVIANAAKVAKMKTWQDGNNEVLQHVEKWLEIRKKEHDIEAAREEEVLRRIRHKEKIKRLNEREKIRVIEQLEEKARKNAEYEIKHLEIQRKASYKEHLYQLVEIADKKRNYHIAFGLLFLLCGCVMAGFFIQPILIVLGVVGGIILITLIIFYRAYRVSQVAPYDDNPETIERKIQEREEELFAESMEVIHRNEREYEQKMAVDKMERKKRKQERRHREEVLRYLEQHPEIPIDPEQGDVDIQLKEYLLKNDPSHQETQQAGKGGIEIIHERSREEDEEEDDHETEEKEKEQKEKTESSREKGSVKSSLQSDLPETRASLRGSSSTPVPAPSASSKYLLGDSQQRGEGEENEGLSSFQLHIRLLTLSHFLSSFLNTKPTADVFVSLHWNPFSDFSSSPEQLQSSTLLFQTDSQKSLGDLLIWRYESGNSSTIIIPPRSSTSSSPSSQGSLSFELHSTRPSPSGDTLLASAAIPISDLLLPSAPKKQSSISLDLIRSDVIKVCHLSLEYHTSIASTSVTLP